MGGTGNETPNSDISQKDKKYNNLFSEFKIIALNNKLIFRSFLLYGNFLFFNWILKLYKCSFLPSVDNFVCYTNLYKSESRVISINVNNKKVIKVPWRDFCYTMDEFYLGNTLEPKTIKAFLKYSYWVLSPSNLFECCMILPEGYHEVNSILLRIIYYISNKSIELLFNKLIPITVISYVSYFNYEIIKNFAESDIICEVKSKIKTSFEYIRNLFSNMNVLTIYSPIMSHNLVPNLPLIIWNSTPIMGMFLIYKSKNINNIAGIAFISMFNGILIGFGNLIPKFGI